MKLKLWKIFSLLLCLIVSLDVIGAKGWAEKDPKRVIVERMPISGLYGKKCGPQIKEIFVKALPHEKKLYSKRYFINKRIPLQVTAYYTYIREALARNERTGKVLAAELSDCTPKPSALQYPYEVEVVEVRGGKIYPVPGNLWEAGPGWVLIKKQGRYRIRVRLAGYQGKPVKDPYKDPNPFRLGWAYSPLITVYDPAKDRGSGSKVLVDMLIQAPGQSAPFTENNIYFDGKCNNQPFKVCGRCDRTIEFSAYARWGVLEEESEGGGTLRSLSRRPLPYRKAIWELVDRRTGKILTTLKGSQVFHFRPKEYGDGRYLLYAYSVEQYQGKLGIQNFFGRHPARTYIQVQNCGITGVHTEAKKPGTPKSAMLTRKKGQDLAKKVPKTIKVEIPRFDRLKKTLVVEKKKLTLQVKAPSPPSSKPKLSKVCESLEKSILERRRRLRVPCDHVVHIMNQLLALAERVPQTVKLLSEKQKEIARLEEAWYKPYKEFSQEYTRVIAKAQKYIIPPQVLSQFKRRSSVGTAPVIGDGLPPTAFLYNIRKIVEAKALDEAQVKVLTKWARQRRKDLARLKSQNAKLTSLNQEINRLGKSLLHDIQLFHNLQYTLKRLYCSGTYEHCLGLPLKSYCGRTVGYTVELIPREHLKKDQNTNQRGGPDFSRQSTAPSPLNIPGLNLRIDLSPRDLALLTRKASMLDVPKRPKRWRLKGDGIWQLVHDRKLMQAVLKAKELETYANCEFGVVMDSIVAKGLETMGALGVKELSPEKIQKIQKYLRKYNPYAKAQGFVKRTGKALVSYVGNMFKGLYTAVAKVPVHKLPNFYEAVGMMFKMTADNLVKAYMGATRYAGNYYAAINKLQEWDKKYPNPEISPPQINAQYVATALVALGAEKKIEESFEAGVHGALDLLSLISSAKDISKVMKMFKVNRETALLLQKTAAGSKEALSQVQRLAETYKTVSKAELRLAELRQARVVRAREFLQDVMQQKKMMQEQAHIMEDFLIRQRQNMHRSGPFQEKFRIKTKDGQEIAVGERISEGTFKEVYEAQDPSKVVQILKVSGKKLEFNLESMKLSAKALEEAGIPYPKFQIQKLSDGRVALITDRIAQSMVIKDVSKWTAEHKAAFAMMLKRLNQKGYVFLDAKPPNVYFFRDAQGVLHCGVIDVDAIGKWGKVREIGGVKVTAEQAQAFMTYGKKIKGLDIISPNNIQARAGIAYEATPSWFREKYGNLPMSNAPTKLSGEFFAKTPQELTTTLNQSASEFIKSLRASRALDTNTLKSLEKTLIRGNITQETVKELQKTLQLSAEEVAQLKKIAELSKLEKTLSRTVNQAKNEISTVEKTLAKEASLAKKEGSTLTNKITEAEKTQKQLAKETSVKKVLKTEKGEDLALGEELGRGVRGIVYLNAKDPSKVVKISESIVSLKAEKEASEILKKAGIEHTEILETGKLKDGSYFSVQRRLKPEEIPAEKLIKMQGGKLTPEQQLALLELIDKLNRHGILYGDLKPANIYFRKVDGGWVAGILDKGGIRELKGQLVFQKAKLRDGRVMYLLKKGPGETQGGLEIKVTPDFLEVYGDFLKKLGKYEIVRKTLKAGKPVFLKEDIAKKWIRYVQSLQVHGITPPKGVGIKEAQQMAIKMAMDKIVSITNEGAWGNWVTRYGLNREWLNLYLREGSKAIKTLKKDVAVRKIEEAVSQMTIQSKKISQGLEETRKVIHQQLQKIEKALQEKEARLKTPLPKHKSLGFIQKRLEEISYYMALAA